MEAHHFKYIQFLLLNLQFLLIWLTIIPMTWSISFSLSSFLNNIYYHGKIFTTWKSHHFLGRSPRAALKLDCWNVQCLLQFMITNLSASYYLELVFSLWVTPRSRVYITIHAQKSNIFGPQHLISYLLNMFLTNFVMNI